MTASSTRRGFLKKGIIGGAVLLVGGAFPLLRGSGPLRAPTKPLRVLSPAEYGIFAAAAARLVPGDDAPAGWPTADQVDCAGKLDEILAGIHPKAAAEFRQLLRTFENGMTGLLSTGAPQTFTAASPEQQVRRLESWRHSRFALMRSGYQAMKRLAHATYYASPSTFALVGYPGPPTIAPTSPAPG